LWNSDFVKQLIEIDEIREEVEWGREIVCTRYDSKNVAKDYWGKFTKV